jgi:enoyl-CoA hydratase
VAVMTRTDSDDGIVTLTFTRPEKLNAISPGMWNVLRDTLEDFAERDELRVLVITAEGRYFTSGNDQVERDDLLGRQGPPVWFRDGVDVHEIPKISIRREYRRLHLLFDELEAVEKPIVVAIQGRCLGVGVEMAVSCDFRLASDAASFWVPEIVRVGALPGSGGISRLTRLVGPHWARWLSMAGEEVTAQEAVSMGLVHAVYPADAFMERVMEFARRLVAIPADLLGAAKIGIDTAADVDRTAARNFDRLANTVFLTSPAYLQQKRDFEQRSRDKAGSAEEHD